MRGAKLKQKLKETMVRAIATDRSRSASFHHPRLHACTRKLGIDSEGVFPDVIRIAASHFHVPIEHGTLSLALYEVPSEGSLSLLPRSEG